MTRKPFPKPWELPVAPIVRSQHLTVVQLAELVNLFHLGRTALAGGDDSRYARKLWAAREFAKEQGINETVAYKELDAALDSGQYRGSDFQH